MATNNKTSVLIPQQLPAFIRDNPDYSNFVLFLQAYYEWLEQQDGILDISKNLLNYHDIDNLTAANTAANGTDVVVNEFLNYFYNDFLSYFPKDILANKAEVIKLAKQLYSSKGTPASYEFLFRVLYNSPVDFFITGDAVLRASAGTWYIPRSLLLLTNDTDFLGAKNLKVIGLQSKALASIENIILNVDKIEIFIANIERLFNSGEMVQIVDADNQPAYFLNGTYIPKYVVTNSYVGDVYVVYQGLTYQSSKNVPAGINPTNPAYWNLISPGATTLTSQLASSVQGVNIVNPGSLYNQNDPVVFYGGLADNTSVGATGVVDRVDTGSLQYINIVTGGFGYTFSDTSNTQYTTIDIQNIPGAAARVATLNPVNNFNITLPTDAIVRAVNANVTLGNALFSIVNDGPIFAANASANITSTLANTLTFITFNSAPISGIFLDSKGSAGINATPVITAQTFYHTSNTQVNGSLPNLGILAPIVIVNGGVNYSNTDTINIINGSGFGARAALTVNASGSIVTASYIAANTINGMSPYPIGGLGYNILLPTISVSSNTGGNAVLEVHSTLGGGATFSAATDSVGAVRSVKITDPGSNYISQPSVSLSVQDIYVTNLYYNNLPQVGQIIYQGTSIANSTYISTIGSITPVITSSNPFNSTYLLRVYNYSSIPSASMPMYLKSNSQFAITISTTQKFPSTGSPIIAYGNGLATGTVKFSDAVNIGQGQYLDTSGQLSEFNVLQSTNYNNYTYELTLEKEILKYRDVLLNLLHPAGTRVLGRFDMKSNSEVNFNVSDGLDTGLPLSYYTQQNSSGILVDSDGQPSTNTIEFFNMYGQDVRSFLFSNSVIKFTTSAGDNYVSEILSIGNVNNDDLIFDPTSTEDMLTEVANTANGTITANTTSKIVIGSGTNFKTQMNVLTMLTTTSNVVLGEIVSISSNTVLTLKNNSTANVSGNTFYQSYIEDLMQEFSENFVVLKDSIWTLYGNVATATANANSSTINITSLTGQYDIVNDGMYSNTSYPLKDIIRTGDRVTVNNESGIVLSVDYVNNILTLTNNLTYAANGLLSVYRTIQTSNVRIFGPVGQQYDAQISTQDGNILTAEDGNTILIG